MSKLTIHTETWHYNSVFRIAREARTSSSLIMLELEENGLIGKGEACPYPRYNESVAGVVAQIESVRGKIENNCNNSELLNILPAGAARNALDCAMLDLASKQQKKSVASIMCLNFSRLGKTCDTIVIDTPEKMCEAAVARKNFPLLKVKLDADNIIERIAAVRRASPQAKIIIDANEAWSIDDLLATDSALFDLGVELIEQPLKAGDDAALAQYKGKIPLCADESTQGVDNLEYLRQCYGFLNIKLDKTGGLTAAMAQVIEAKNMGFGIMVGCMVGTSLAMAPAAHLAGLADYLDLDGPVFLKNDRDMPIKYDNGNYTLPDTGLWGEG